MTATLSAQLAGAGSARGADAAGKAVDQALGALDGNASLVLAFPSGIDPATAAADAGAAAGHARVAGMTSNGAIGDGRAIEAGCSAIAFAADVLDVGLGVGVGASRDPREAARRAANTALAEAGDDFEHCVLLLFIDTRSGDQACAVTGAYAAAGPAIPLAGGAAGGSEPAQFAPLPDGGCEALTDSVVAVAVRSAAPLGVGLAHGAQPCAVPAIVTRADGRTVLQLDGRAAEDVYLEKLGHGGVDFEDHEFEDLAVTHPLAQPELSGDVRLRHVLGRGADGGLACATHIPPNAAVEFTAQSEETIVRSAYDAVSEALAPLDGAPPRAALIFDCAGRKRALRNLGGSLDREVQALMQSFGTPAPPLAGLYTHGEIGRVRGAMGDRNHALVVVAFG